MLFRNIPIYGGKWVGRHAGAKESGASRPDQKLAHWEDLLGQLLSQKPVYKNFGPDPPP